MNCSFVTSHLVYFERSNQAYNIVSLMVILSNRGFVFLSNHNHIHCIFTRGHLFPRRSDGGMLSVTNHTT